MATTRTKNTSFSDELQRLLPGPRVQLAWLVLAAVFVFFYWSSLHKLIRVWYSTDDYQHGFFVPLFALFLLWLRRDMIVPFSGRGSWWGLPFFVIWAAMRWAAVYFRYESLPEMSMIPFFAGVALFVGGWQGLRWAWPAVLFLVFMIPLPGAVQGWFSQQLQTISTRVSGFVIQTLGISAVVVGHTIQLSDRAEPLDVAQACSGLRMLMLFFALCVGAAFVVRKPLWEKLFLVASAAPIAVIANSLRIVLTAIIYEILFSWPSIGIDPEQSFKFIHDWAGYIVEMPAGLLLLWFEMYLLSKLLISPMLDRPLVAGRLAAEEVAKTSGKHLRNR